MKVSLGDMLYRFRVERNLEAQMICNGVCGVSTMSYYENNERIPDSLTFELLMERMGVSMEEFTFMVAEKEMEYFEWREDVYTAIEENRWNELEELLQSKIVTEVYCNEKLEKQFQLYIKGIYYVSQKQYKEAVFLLKEAIQLTIPDSDIIKRKRILLAAIEIHILILYLYYGIEGNVLSKEEGKKIFDTLESYISNGDVDVNEQAKCYPKLVCIGLNSLKEQFLEEEQINLCEKAVKILRLNNTFHDITELLRLYISLLEKSKSKEVVFYRKHYEVFCDLLQEEGIDIDFRPEIRVGRKRKMYLINEYFFSKRREKGYTQRVISEGVCEPETYSRMESGKRIPTRRNYKMLVERLDINWCYFRGELDTYDSKAFQLRRLQRSADIEGRREDSLKILEELEVLLDMNSIENYQYIKCNEYMTKYRLNMLDISETYSKLQELLRLTQKDSEDISQLTYYSQIELEIIGDMAQLLRWQKKSQKGIEYIETVIGKMKNSKIHIEYQWNGFCYLLSVLSGLYFDIYEYDKSLSVSKYLKKNMLRRRDASNLSVILDEIADNLEHMGERYSEEYKKLYRHTYYIADFYSIKKVTNFAKKYYEENFDAKMNWY